LRLNKEKGDIYEVNRKMNQEVEENGGNLNGKRKKERKEETQ
jgi:hypothetical protein